MKGVKRQNVFEVRSRLARVRWFRKLWISYCRSVRHDGYYWEGPTLTGDGFQIRQDLSRILPAVKDAMVDARIESIYTYTQPPAMGGRSHVTDIMDDLFVMHKMNMSPQLVVDLLDQAIGVYESEIVPSILRTLNPFHWLHRLVEWMIGYPFRLWAGLYDQRPMGDSTTLLKNTATLVGLVLADAGAVLGIAEKLGYLGTIRAAIDRVIR